MISYFASLHQFPVIHKCCMILLDVLHQNLYTTFKIIYINNVIHLDRYESIHKCIYILSDICLAMDVAGP